MSARLDASAVQYAFRLGDAEVPVNPLIGSTLRIVPGGDPLQPLWTQDQDQLQPGLLLPLHDQAGAVRRLHHEPGTRCHYDAGTCREPSWGEQFCMTDHIVYLSNSSGVKVGITRATQLPTRWIDQGARQGIAHHAGVDPPAVGFCRRPVPQPGGRQDQLARLAQGRSTLGRPGRGARSTVCQLVPRACWACRSVSACRQSSR